jgi:hypothetical protein
MSFLETLINNTHLDYVLKFFGVVLFVIGFINGWHQLHLVAKILIVIGPIAWFVGARFSKIYR